MTVNRPDAKTPASPRRSAIDWAGEHGATSALLGELENRARIRRRRQRRAVVGAVAAMALAALGTMVWRGRTDAAPGSGVAVVSLPLRQTLPDGSIAELRVDARIAVDFSGAERRVALLAGVAHFAVAKNPARPFIVSAGGIDVRAVGTAFAVELSPGGVEVVVTEGRVAVDRPADNSPEPIALVRANESVRVAASGNAPVTPLAPATVATRLAWRVPHLDFSATRLDEVIAAFNRHATGAQLALGDASLAALQISGVVRADQTDALVSLLVGNYGVVAEAPAGGPIVLRRR